MSLLGKVFGKLTVIDSAGREQYGGRPENYWRCQCSCGRVEVYPQRRLVSEGINGCAVCRAVRCVICGEPVLDRPRSNVCSDECNAEKKRGHYRAHYHRKAADPNYNRQRYLKLLERFKKDPELEESYKALALAAQRRNREINKDRINARNREYYAENAEHILQLRRERKARLSEDELEALRERAKGYWKKYATKWREALRQDPARHEEYLMKQREYRNQAALKRMLADAAMLQDLFESGDE